MYEKNKNKMGKTSFFFQSRRGSNPIRTLPACSSLIKLHLYEQHGTVNLKCNLAE